MISHSFYSSIYVVILSGYVKPRLANVIWYNVGLVCIAIMAYTTNFMGYLPKSDANAMVTSSSN